MTKLLGVALEVELYGIEERLLRLDERVCVQNVTRLGLLKFLRTPVDEKDLLIGRAGNNHVGTVDAVLLFG